MYARRAHDMVTLERLSRVVCVNRRLESHGLPGLPVKCAQTGRPTIMSKAREAVYLPTGPPSTEEQRARARQLGLSDEEHYLVRGEHAELLGLHISKRIADRIRAYCRRKLLQIVTEMGDKEGCRTMIILRLKRLAGHERKRKVREAGREEVKNAVKALNTAHALCP